VVCFILHWGKSPWDNWIESLMCVRSGSDVASKIKILATSGLQLRSPLRHVIADLNPFIACICLTEKPWSAIFRCALQCPTLQHFSLVCSSDEQYVDYLHTLGLGEKGPFPFLTIEDFLQWLKIVVSFYVNSPSTDVLAVFPKIDLAQLIRNCSFFFYPKLIQILSDFNKCVTIKLITK
jgi:hypothetical protein